MLYMRAAQNIFEIVDGSAGHTAAVHLLNPGTPTLQWPTLSLLCTQRDWPTRRPVDRSYHQAFTSIAARLSFSPA